MPNAPTTKINSLINEIIKDIKTKEAKQTKQSK